MKRVILALPLGVLLMGQNSDCSRDVDVRRFTGANNQRTMFSMSSVDGKPLSDTVGTYLGDGDGNRFEMWRLDPNTPRDFERNGNTVTLDHTRHITQGIPENQYVSISGQHGAMLPVRFSGPFSASPEPFGFVFDEGECSLTVPWDGDDVAPHLRATLPDEGLGQIITSEFNAALREMNGNEENIGVFWGVEWITGLYLNQNLETQFFVDPGYDQNMDPNHRICLKAFAGTGGQLEWNADGSRFVLADSVGFLFTGILNLFNIGDCGYDRLLSMTMCGTFGVTEEGQTPKRRNPYKQLEPPTTAGQVAFSLDEVKVQINDWPKIKAACNNNKPDLEAGMETILAETVESGMNELADAFNFFTYSRCFASMEGLTCVIAEEVTDPQYALANAIGLCHRTRPTIKGYLNSVQYEEMP